MFYQKPGIYKITNIINNKCYVGSSINISVRISAHKNSLKNKKHCNLYLQDSVNKYSIDNFIFEVVEYCSENLLLEKEEFYINFYNSNNNKFGYNIESFSKGRKRHSEETKLKISLSNKGKRTGKKSSQETINLIKAKSKRPKTEEHKNKIRLAHLGKKRNPFSEEWKKKMSISSKNTKYYNVYDLNNQLIINNQSTLYISKYFNVCPSSIGQSVKNNWIFLKKYKIIQQIGQNKLL